MTTGVLPVVAGSLGPLVVKLVSKLAAQMGRLVFDQHGS